MAAGELLADVRPGPGAGGRLGDLRGRRALFLGGVGLFAAGSLVSGLAPAAGIVILARLLQGPAGA